MLDLSLISPSVNSFHDNTSTYILAHSRRPAILTFSSPMVDTVSRIWRMPLYVFGWKKEAETLETGMMEGVEFAKGWRNLPGSLRLELQSQERMQVYTATVKFIAKFKGLRYVALSVDVELCSGGYLLQFNSNLQLQVDYVQFPDSIFFRLQLFILGRVNCFDGHVLVRFIGIC